MKPYTEQIENLKKLEDGWYDGYGKAPTIEGLQWLNDRLDIYLDMDLTTPAIFPSFEGGVHIEFIENRNDISIDINLISKQASLSYLNLDTQEDDDVEYDLNNHQDWLNLNMYLQNKLK